MMRAMVSSVIAALCLHAALARVNFRGSGQLAKSQVEDILGEELTDVHHHLAKYTEELRQMFASLPKNEHGNLGHQAVQSALHRFFVNRHGWYLRGLEGGASLSVPGSVSDKDRVPELLQEAFESKIHERGADLHALAALAASLDDLVRKEVRAHLDDVFQASSVSPDGKHDRVTSEQILDTYFMSFLLEHNWTVNSGKDITNKKQIFYRKYPLYRDALAWKDNVVNSRLPQNWNEPIDFETTLDAANGIGEDYHTLNELECEDLRSSLQSIEAKKPGRIRLSVFYNTSMHTHWNFGESVETLRNLGAIDESDSKAKYVIIPNYAMSRPNCVNASNLFEICCRNMCEDVMSRIEKEIGTSTATWPRIAAFVANLPSKFVKAPRELPANLLQRLEEVAVHHGGEVPIHGRLFKQWLHHAYPLECPYPHEAGTINPRAWTGEDDQQASEEEKQRQVQADTCSVDWQGKMICGEESEDLPWSSTEELLTTNLSPVAGQSASSNTGRMLLLSVAVLGLLAAAFAANPRFYQVRDRQTRMVLVLLVVAGLAYAAGLMDGTLVGIAVVGSLAARFVTPRLGCAAALDSQKLPKCV